jgi:hypothetical protein
MAEIEEGLQLALWDIMSSMTRRALHTNQASPELQSFLSKQCQLLIGNRILDVLMHAIRLQNTDAVRALLSTFTKSSFVDETSKHRPLIAAHRHRNMVSLLLDHGVIDYPDKDGKTALHYAIEYGWNDVIDTLLRAIAEPCDVSTSDWLYENAINVAIRVGEAGVLQSLLTTYKLSLDDKRVDKTMVNLVNVIQKRQIPLIEWCINSNASAINIPINGRFPLAVALRQLAGSRAMVSKYKDDMAMTQKNTDDYILAVLFKVDNINFQMLGESGFDIFSFAIAHEMEDVLKHTYRHANLDTAVLSLHHRILQHHSVNIDKERACKLFVLLCSMFPRKSGTFRKNWKQCATILIGRGAVVTDTIMKTATTNAQQENGCSIIVRFVYTHLRNELLVHRCCQPFSGGYTVTKDSMFDPDITSLIFEHLNSDKKLRYVIDVNMDTASLQMRAIEDLLRSDADRTFLLQTLCTLMPEKPNIRQFRVFRRRWTRLADTLISNGAVVTEDILNMLKVGIYNSREGLMIVRYINKHTHKELITGSIVDFPSRPTKKRKLW